MSSLIELTWLGGASAGLVSGYMLGLAYFSHLHRWSGRIVGGAPPSRIIAASAGRLLMAVAVFFALTQWGAAAAVGGLIGFSIARRAIVSRTEPG